MGFIKAIVLVGVLALVLAATFIEARPDGVLLEGVVTNEGVSYIKIQKYLLNML